MASPSSVISMGFGSWGSVNLLPTLGYGSGGAAATTSGLTLEAIATFIPGAPDDTYPAPLNRPFIFGGGEMP